MARAFLCDPRAFDMTDAMMKAYEEFGFILIKGFLDKDELENLRKTVEDTDIFSKKVFGVSTEEGGRSSLTLWNHPGNDVTGMLARSEKVVGTAEKILGGEVYHYHSKLITKDPNGQNLKKYTWHQDYGYWYKNGCLFPDMLSVFIPIDPCKRDNGCLQVIECSQRCGRLEHRLLGGQQQCDPERVRQIKKALPVKYAEMDRGDALFFNCNLLHCSESNTSDTKRWVLICCYNKASNNPVIVHHHPWYTKLTKVADTAIRDCRNYTDMTGKEFLETPNKK